MTEFPTDTLPYPEPSKATTVMVLALLGVFMMPLVLSPFAWVMGRNELKAIDAGRRSPEGRRVARIGMIVGMVATILHVIVAGVLIFALVANSG